MQNDLDLEQLKKRNTQLVAALEAAAHLAMLVELTRPEPLSDLSLALEMFRLELGLLGDKEPALTLEELLLQNKESD